MQLNYTQEPAKLAAGMIAYGGPTSGLALANEDAATLPFGKAVKFGTNPEKQFSLVDGGVGEEFAGVLVCQHAQIDPGNVGVAQFEAAKVLASGKIGVVVQSAVAPGDSVFYLNTGVNAGDFGSAGDVDISASARWLTVAAIGEVAVLEINKP